MSIPISVVTANGVQTQFVPANLALRVTPHVTQRDGIGVDGRQRDQERARLHQHRRPRRSHDPTRRRRPTILVADGHTAVIGGIYTRNTGLAYSKVPFFGDIPMLGWFFKNRRENDERTELLIFITPKITNRANLRCQ